MSGDNVVVGRNIEGAPIDPMQSQTVAFSHYNNFSAQLPVDPETSELVEGGVQDQAAQCLDNIEAIACGIDHALSDVVRLTVFVKDVRDIAAVDEVVSAYFPAYVPARTNVVANDLPMGALVQMEALLSNGEGTIPDAPQAGDLVKLTNSTSEAPVSRLSSQTVAFSHYNNVSAQLGIDPKTGRLVEGGAREQTAQCLRNVKAILASIDVPFDDIVKVNVFLKDLGDLDAVNEAYSTFFPDSGIARAAGYVPARTVVEVADLEMGALVQVEAVVSHGDGTPPQEVEARHGLIIEASNTDAAPARPLGDAIGGVLALQQRVGAARHRSGYGRPRGGRRARAGRAVPAQHQGRHRERRPLHGRRREGERVLEGSRRYGRRERSVRRLLPRGRSRAPLRGRAEPSERRARADRRHLRQRRRHPADGVAAETRPSQAPEPLQAFGAFSRPGFQAASSARYDWLGETRTGATGGV